MYPVCSLCQFQSVFYGLLIFLLFTVKQSVSQIPSAVTVLFSCFRHPLSLSFCFICSHTALHLLFHVSHFPPFCYYSNRRAVLPWKGHTPRGPPLSSCSEGRMRRRRRKELREYVCSPPPPLTLSSLTLQLHPLPHRWSCEAAWECRVTDVWPAKPGCT